jgi:hypothetical protein
MICLDTPTHIMFIPTLIADSGTKNKKENRKAKARYIPI